MERLIKLLSLSPRHTADGISSERLNALLTIRETCKDKKKALLGDPANLTQP